MSIGLFNLKSHYVTGAGKLSLHHFDKGFYFMLIANQHVVAIDYTLSNDAGEVIDSSAGADRWSICMVQAILLLV